MNKTRTPQTNELSAQTGHAKLGDFVRIGSDSIGRVYSETKVTALDGRRYTRSETETIVQYSREYSLLVNAVFDLAEKVEHLESIPSNWM